jgi:hypothetical protein
MKKIKEEKNVEILVNIRYENKDDQLIQTYEFSSSNKKNLNYLFDARFLFKRKIDRMINNFLLDGYISRIDEENKITIKYKKQEKPKNCMRKLQAYIPPFFGCIYCEKAKIEGDFIYCPEKNKHYTAVSQGVKRCPVFRTKEKILT